MVVLTGGSSPQSQRAANKTFIITIRSERVGFDTSQLRKSNYNNTKTSHFISFLFHPISSISSILFHSILYCSILFITSYSNQSCYFFITHHQAQKMFKSSETVLIFWEFLRIFQKFWKKIFNSNFWEFFLIFFLENFMPYTDAYTLERSENLTSTSKFVWITFSYISVKQSSHVLGWNIGNSKPTILGWARIVRNKTSVWVRFSMIKVWELKNKYKKRKIRNSMLM